MSGIEIGGLVLATAPLLISAIEHYNDELDPIKAFLQWKGKLAEIVVDLWHEHNLYSMTLCVLLKEFTTPAELDEMTTNPGSDLWKNGEMGQKIRSKLGLAHMGYLSTIEEIESIMTTLSSHLNIQKANRVLKFCSLPVHAILPDFCETDDAKRTGSYCHCKPASLYSRQSEAQIRISKKAGFYDETARGGPTVGKATKVQ